MRKGFKLMLIAAIAAFIVSCASDAKPSKEEVNELKEEARTAINQEREKLLKSDGALDTVRAKTMIDMYMTFVQNNPGDEDAGEFLFQAGSLCMGKGDYDRSIRLYKNFVKNYPNHDRKVEGTFLIAFVYDTYLDNKGMAEDWYKKVIEDFPRHELALQARAAIRNLTMTDEELLKMFEEKNKVKEEV